MINGLTKEVFARSKANTFIGGIAKMGGTGVNAPINTPALLSARIGLPVSAIRNFVVKGNDVEFLATENYTITANAFGSLSLAGANQNITYYHDLKGFLRNNASGISSARVFSFCGELTSVILPNCFQTGEAFCISATKLEVLQLPSLVTTGNQPFWNNPKLKSFVANRLVSFGANNAFTNNTLMEVCETPLANRLTNIHYQNCVSLKKAINDNATIIGNSAFQSCSAIEEISIKKATTLGSNVFLNIKLNCLIRANISLLTSSAGSPNPNLTYAKNTRLATVEFYDNAGNYVSNL